MKKIFKLVFWAIFILSMLTCSNQKYEANWESLKQYNCPDWFRDAKFGIYFHWGPYSVPAYKTEWYSHYMYVEGHDINKYHIKKYGKLSEFGYKDFIPMLKGEKFNPDEWVDLFVKAGARFAGPVAEHADGFAMWASDLTKWDARDMGPKRDVVGEMEKAVRKRGLKFISTLHHQWLYAWYPTMQEDTDASNPEFEDLYGPKVPFRAFNDVWKDSTLRPDKKFNDRWLKRAKEVVDKYQPDLVWFDIKLDILEENTLTQFLKYYYNKADGNDQGVVCTYKSEDFVKGTAVLDLERARMSETKDFPWLTDDSIDWTSWCDVVNPEYKTVNRMIDFLVDVVSKNGCVMLNITPKANGEIPQPVVNRLLEIGKWLEQNGEAIYGTRPWKIYGEGPTKVVEGHLSERKNKDSTFEDIRFTTKNGYLYLIILDWVEDGKFTVNSLGSETILIKNMEFISGSNEFIWNQKSDRLQIEVKGEKPNDSAFVFKIEQ